MSRSPPNAASAIAPVAADATEVPPRLAVVDGTHLCLLPPSLPSSSAAAAAKKDNDDCEEKDSDSRRRLDLVDVPAVPLRSVPLFLSKRCRSLESLAAGNNSGERSRGGGKGDEEEKQQRGDDDDDDDERDHGEESDDDDGDSDDDDEPSVKMIRSLPLALSSVERPVRSGWAAAIVDDGGEVLVSAAPVSPPARGDDDRDRDDDQEEEVEQSSGTIQVIRSASPERGGGVFPGGGGNNLLLEVDNRGAGCIIADFVGLGGYDQVLFLPPLSPSRIVSETDDPANGEGKKKGRRRSDEQQKESSSSSSKRDERKDMLLLRTILRHSVLTDGKSVLLPRRSEVGPTMTSARSDGPRALLGGTGKRRRGSFPRIALRTVESLSDDGDSGDGKSGGSGEGKGRNLRRRRRGTDEGEDEAGAAGEGEQEERTKSKKRRTSPPPQDDPQGTSGDDGDDSTSNKDDKRGRSSSGTKGNWARVLEAGMRSRLEREERQKRAADRAREERTYLASRSRRVLEEFVAATSSSPSMAAAAAAGSGTAAGAAFTTGVTNGRKGEREDGATAAAVSGKDGGARTPQLQMLRMRYCVRQGGEGSASIDGDGPSADGMSVLIHAEVDVLLCDRVSEEKKVQENTKAASNSNNGSEGRSSATAANCAHVADDALRELHLAFAPGPCPCTDTLSVSTRSGVVPSLGPGGCVTIVVSVEVTGIRTMTGGRGGGAEGAEGVTDPGGDESSAVVLAINAHWKTTEDGLTSSSETTAAAIEAKAKANQEHERNKLRPGGAAVGALRLSLESIMLSGGGAPPSDGKETDRCVDFFAAPPAQWPLVRSGRLRQPHVVGRSLMRSEDDDDDKYNHDDDENNASFLSTAQPTAVYDYRNPRVLEIDASASADGGRREWENFVKTINAMTSFGNKVDIDREGWGDGGSKDGGPDTREGASIEGGDDRATDIGKGKGEKGTMTMRLIVLGRTPEERLALVQLVLRHMPESARILDPAETGGYTFPGEESLMTRNLLVRMKDELDALDRHRKMTKEEDFNMGTLREMAELQRRTDEAASWIRRGWDPAEGEGGA